MQWLFKESIPISTSALLGEPIKSVLHRHFISTNEELISLLAVPSLEPQLKALLGMDSANIKCLYEELIQTIENKYHDKFLTPVPEDCLENFMFGSLHPPLFDKKNIDAKKSRAIKESDEPGDFFIAPMEKSKVNLISGLFPVRNQGKRGTCVSFGTIVMMEYLLNKSVKLSEQFLYWGAKMRDNNPDDAGTLIKYAMMCLKEIGVCPEIDWPYDPGIKESEYHGHPPESVIEKALQYRISDKFEINPASVNDLRHILAGSKQFPARVISFAIPVFDSWFKNPITYHTGKIVMPLPEETIIGGHCMALVGYQDASDWPGGGFFILQNSWGEKWASECPFGAGCGTIPYAFISKYCWEAWTADIAGLHKNIDKPEDFSKNMIIGRKQTDKSTGNIKNAMFAGNLVSMDKSSDNKSSARVFIDCSFPHIALICGSRGSGKSYTLGVLAEELNQNAKDIGVLLIDPLGIFWSLKNSNSSETQIAKLGELGLDPGGLDNVKIFAPEGAYRKDPLPYLDLGFSIKVSDLGADEWSMIFDIDPFGPQGLLIGEAIQNTIKGYELKENGETLFVPPVTDYTLGDLINCINKAAGIINKESGFSKNTRRSVVYRLKGAAGWGIFTITGTDLTTLIQKGRISVLDLSHSDLDESIKTLVVGILAKKILSARISTSKNQPSLSEKDNIPITWLMIDEAHLFIPRNKKTPAAKALTQYAKLGRQPGCALVMATQRPAATDDEIVSQTDILIGHTLSFDDDIKALIKRVPCHLPKNMATSGFIRKLPRGTAIIGDQHSGNSGQVIMIRPRKSFHAGEEAKPNDRQKND